jgi:hypothetical protein
VDVSQKCQNRTSVGISGFGSQWRSFWTSAIIAANSTQPSHQGPFVPRMTGQPIASHKRPRNISNGTTNGSAEIIWA